MPNRYIREGLIDSDSVNALSDQAFNFYVRLLLKADDFGRFDGREIVLKSSLYPLKPEKRVSDISRWLAECEKSGLIVLYAVDGKKYIEILNFNQQIRIKHSKYPAYQPQNKGKMLSRCSADDKHMLTSITYNRRHITRDAIASSAGAREERQKIHVPETLKNSHDFLKVWDKWLEHWQEKYNPLTTGQQENHIEELLRIAKAKGVEQAIATLKNSMNVAKLPKLFEPFEKPDRASDEDDGITDRDRRLNKMLADAKAAAI